MTPTTEPLSEIDAILAEGTAAGASDLHISSDHPPAYRVNGRLLPSDRPPYSREEVLGMALAMMNPGQRQAFEHGYAADLGYSSGGERYRVNVYRERGKVALAIRHLAGVLPTLAELGLPAPIQQLAGLKTGLVLVCGATGSGKSTTLAAVLNSINEQREAHIITVEDPVEFVYENKRSLVHQREVHTDVDDFAGAIRSALRQDPDVMLIGEMRDLETMRAAITAAETGHLVFSSLHSGDAVGVIERLVGAFPADEQEVVRQRVALTLRAVVAQHLLPTIDGTGRAPAVEILMVNTAVSNLIGSGRSKQIYSVIESGRAEGMQTLDQALAGLVADGRVDAELARSRSRDPVAFGGLVRRYL